MDFIPFEGILFYATAVVMVAAALLTVLAKNILHSAVALICVFFGTAVLYFLLSAEFIAVAQVMVYIGGVVVFVVFTILLTSRLGERIQETSRSRKILAFVFSLLIAILAFAFLKELGTSLQNQSEDFATLSAIGKRLISSGETGFLLPFEAISLLLLISLIGAVTIARIPHDDKNEEAK
jgi:NADH-quinone oxidoreductase subunit J